MFFNFTFRHYLTKPHDLAAQLQSSSMRGFKKRVLFVFLLGVILFGLQNWWGMGTESLTVLLTSVSTADYTVARYASLLGAVCWAVIYISFHLYGFAFLLSRLTGIAFKKLLPLQLLVTGLLLLEKALVFLVFVMKGEVANVSFLSFGPLAITFLEIDYWIFFFNQLTITTIIIIALQSKFIRPFIGNNGMKKVVFALIVIHVAMALITAGVGYIPFERILDEVIGGGVIK